MLFEVFEEDAMDGNGVQLDILVELLLEYLFILYFGYSYLIFYHKDLNILWKRTQAYLNLPKPT